MIVFIPHDGPLMGAAMGDRVVTILEEEGRSYFVRRLGAHEIIFAGKVLFRAVLVP